MSRDFIGSQQGRSFLKSPNRDRITRGVRSMSSITLVLDIGVALPFRNTPFQRLVGTETGEFYKEVTITNRLAFNGAKRITRHTFNPVNLLSEQALVSQDANWVEINEPFGLNFSFVSATQITRSNSARTITYDLGDGPHPYSELIDMAESRMNLLNDFPSHEENEDRSLVARVLYGNLQNGGFSSSRQFSTVEYQTVIPRISPTANALTTFWLQPLITITKLQTQGPFLKWRLKTLFGYSTVNHYPDKDHIEEIGCEVNPINQDGDKWLPDYASARAGTICEDFLTLLFSPLAWTQNQISGGVPVNTGPSSVNYPKPTCYPDIV